MNSRLIHSRPTIGVLAGWQVYTGTPDSFLGNVFSGIQAAAHDHKCNLLLACGIDSGLPAWPLISPEVTFVPIGAWNTDGLIIASPFTPEAGDRYAQDLITSGFPVVYAGDRVSGPAVVADNSGGIRQALEHCVKHGHRQIAFIAGRKQSEQGDSGVRLRAFEAALHSLNLPFDPDLVAFGYHHSEGGRQAIQQILSHGKKFTAVLASNDRSAIGVLDGLHQAGFVVPQDIAVIGFDDRLEARAQVPSLTTIHYPMFGLGYQAVELLLRAIDGENIKDEIVHIPTRLVIRESCGCMPGIPAYLMTDEIKAIKAGEYTRQQINVKLNQVMTAAVHNESLWLSQQEVSYLNQRLADAFFLSLEKDDPLTFHLMIQQILARVAARGDDLFAWQAAITTLRDWLPQIRQLVETHLSTLQVEDMFHQVRVAISESARRRSTRSLINQSRQADQVGLITSKFLTALDEHEIFNILNKNLPQIGIQDAAVGYYEAEGDDPIAWCVMQTPGRISGPGRIKAGIKIPSRKFPPDGFYPEETPYQLAILPLRIQKEVHGFVAFDASNLDPCADIVRQLGAALRGVQLYQEAVEARQQAEEGKRLAEGANRLKSRFLSMVSHELRTPLHVISGLSNMLLDDNERVGGNSNLREDLKRIYTSAQHLDGLIRDVLDLASSDVGKLKLVCEPLDMADVLETVASIGEQLAHEKDLSWHVEIAKNMPHIWGDRTRLRQVILNLVSNAVKFTTNGEINLTSLVENGQIKVTVSDTGLGIPQDEQSMIFDEFHQSERTTARGYGGLGLGLAICRKLVELHGGNIAVCSSGKEGEGSSFSFTLPVIEKPMNFPSKEAKLSKALRILFLLKDSRGADLLQKDLIRRGYEAGICIIDDGTDWLASLLVFSPDAVIVDLGLTSECGWEILRTLKENSSTKDIPVLFLSISVDMNHGSLLEIDYLTKPVNSAALSELLLLKGISGPGSDLPNGNVILVVDDEPGILDLHARIVEAQLPNFRVLRARDGREALRIIHQELPVLVMLDLMMPEMDGFTVLEEMRKADITRSIPVVVITGQTLTDDDMSRLNTGVVSVLGKGLFSVDEVLQHLADALAHKRKAGSETQRIALKAMAYIHANYAEQISRSDLAAHVGLSERHLNRCFHQEVGMAPITYLNRYRVKRAKALLDAGDKGITKIAVEVGFSSSSYFTRVFREEVGVSPRAYAQSRSAGREMSHIC